MFNLLEKILGKTKEIEELTGVIDGGVRVVKEGTGLCYNLYKIRDAGNNLHYGYIEGHGMEGMLMGEDHVSITFSNRESKKWRVDGVKNKYRMITKYKILATLFSETRISGCRTIRVGGRPNMAGG